MDPTPISGVKVRTNLEQWIQQLKHMKTEDDKIELQYILHGTQNMYGGTKAPSATKLYEFEDTILRDIKNKKKSYVIKQKK